MPEVLYTTQLPLPPRATAKLGRAARPMRDAGYWATAMAEQNFASEDRLDEKRFNRALWHGLKGESVAFPDQRHGRDLRSGRAKLLKRHQTVAPAKELARN